VRTFSQRNAAWVRVAQELGERAIRTAVDRAGLDLGDVHHLFFVTGTGIATPNLDALLANRLRLPTNLKRTPIFGLGCAGGAGGLARASDSIRAFPRQNAIVLSVELCSLTLQREDLSIGNIIATGLFGDGAAALVVSSGDAPASAPRVVATRSVFYPGTERVMGWDVVESGFKVVLSSKIPELVRSHIRRDVEALLAEHGLQRSSIRHWVVHTGGPKVLRALEEALELPPPALARSWRWLRETGNLSSASVLFVLDELIQSGEPRAGDYGLLAAMGPGFCSELVLLEW
jgi:alkylresorcinol/alkylpyrone synthase